MLDALREHDGARALEQGLNVAQAPRHAVVGQDGEVQRALRPPVLLGEPLEGFHVVVEAQLLAHQARRRERQTRVEPAAADVLHLHSQLVAAPAAPELDQRARVEERDLRGDAHEAA